jgi:hypothetical protein
LVSTFSIVYCKPTVYLDDRALAVAVCGADGTTRDDETLATHVDECGIQSRTGNIIPVATISFNSYHMSDVITYKNAHVNRTMLAEDFLGILLLVVEGNVDANLLQNIDLLR